MTSHRVDNSALLEWFKSKGGTVHHDFGLASIPGMDCGGIALNDIKKDTILFSLPRSLTLSTRTSSLPHKFGEQAWKKYQLHKGWVGLILCLLWEVAQGNNGKWSTYLGSLPGSFDTPMFWTEEELQELQGTSIFDKIGKAEAEADYHDRLTPAIKNRPDLFPPEMIDETYSLERYHVAGSRILSRSFHVEMWMATSETEDEDASGNQNHSPMQIDEENDETVDQDEEDDSDDEDPADVAMVPLADALNARYGSENAKLCYETDDLQMIATKDIKKGDQIWNTYGDPPNSDLLRRYGHVDVIPLEDGSQGNPADIVEIRADLIVDIAGKDSQKGTDAFVERIDWWLEEGGEDVFTLGSNLRIADSLISLIRVVSATDADWSTMRSKGKVPKPKLDPDILRVTELIIQKRLEAYESPVEDDEVIFNNKEVDEKLSPRRRMALIVRLGEKRILQALLKKLANKEEFTEKRKRPTSEGKDSPSSKRRKR